MRPRLATGCQGFLITAVNPRGVHMRTPRTDLSRNREVAYPTAVLGERALSKVLLQQQRARGPAHPLFLPKAHHPCTQGPGLTLVRLTDRTVGATQTPPPQLHAGKSPRVGTMSCRPAATPQL
ncbi:unnamed protein product [Gadus morhua 'NCC']